MSEQPSGGAVYALLRRRLNRRHVIAGGSFLAFGGSAGCGGPATGPGLEGTAEGPGQGADFTAISGSAEDRVIVPEGFTADVVIRWGDPLVGGSEALDIDAVAAGRLLEEGAAALQAGTYGVSCDGMGLFALRDDRLVVCTNHETPEMSRMFPGWREALRERRSVEFVRDNPETVAVMRASVGVSVLELERIDGRWRLVADSPLNRRITADTPIEFSGPAARHAWLGGSESAPGSCLGTFGNCAANATPWGTYLTAEENTNNFFGNADDADFEPLLARANERFGMLGGNSTFRWEAADERFDHAAHPAESMKFGWIVEIDPLDPARPIKKRTALGRLRHEGATTILDASGRPVVYMGDDSGFEYFYKFVGDGRYDPANPGDTDALLDNGTLYVARLNEDGTGDWLPLVYGAPGLTEESDFSSQADVVMRCREAADLLGATPLDRPEDVAVHPHNGKIYLACTQGFQRGFEPPETDEEVDEPAATAAGGTAEAVAGGTAEAPAGGTAEAAAEEDDTPAFPGPDAANPRAPNPYGHILEFTEASDDPTSDRFQWEVFILAGDPATRGLASVVIAGTISPAVAYYAGRSDSAGLSGFACPDNLGFDAAGNLWIVTDGSQPNDNNNGCFVCPTEGPERGRVRQFMSGPVGAEVSGCTFSPDGQTLFLTVQHPGGSSSIAEPSSHWPDGGEAQPRSSLIAIRAVDPARRFYT